MKKNAAIAESGAVPLGGTGERVYLLKARRIETPNGAILYPAGLYGLEPEQAAEWVRDGLAVTEAEWERRSAAAAAAAQADPMMHLAGPKQAPVPAPAPPAGKMWAQGPKGSRKPAVEPPLGVPPAAAGGAIPEAAAPAAASDSTPDPGTPMPEQPKTEEE